MKFLPGDGKVTMMGKWVGIFAFITFSIFYNAFYVSHMRKSTSKNYSEARDEEIRMKEKFEIFKTVFKSREAELREQAREEIRKYKENSE